MFRHILVPLDGSHLAEAALPAASFLAAALQASVTLIHVIEKNAPEEIHGEHHLKAPQEAYTYLANLAKNGFPPNVHVEQHVHTTEVSDVARSIVEHAGEFAPDLIVMCSHGSGGIRDILVGNIAQQVITQGKTPVLLIHPEEPIPTSFNLQRILVPMDGKPDHEQGLPVAGELARACKSSVILLFVVPTLGTLGGQSAATGRLLPGTMSALLEINVQEAENYLESQVKKLPSYHVPATVSVLRGDPAPTIVEFANMIKADLMILGSHGKSGAGAFWAGSVAPKLASLSHIPLLFVPVHPVHPSDR